MVEKKGEQKPDLIRAAHPISEKETIAFSAPPKIDQNYLFTNSTNEKNKKKKEK